MTSPDSPEIDSSIDPETVDGLSKSYRIHSMLHSVQVCMQPTKLEMLDGFEKVSAGHRFTPTESNVRVVISGRDWDEKQILVYGSSSTQEAEAHVHDMKKPIEEIGHDVSFISSIEIANLAVNGSLHETLVLESLFRRLGQRDVDVEYEPEQFPGLILRIVDPKCTFILFSTGSYVIQGLKDPDSVTSALVRLVELLKCVNYDSTDDI